MPDSLDKWLPKDALEFTEVIDPVVIDKEIVADLGIYHPSEKKSFKFRLVRIGSEALATVEVASENWDPQFAKVLGLLKLRVVNEGQADEHLSDDTVPGHSAPMSGWKVVSWTIKRTRFDGHFDPPVPTMLTDRIVWKRLDESGDPAVSSYSWLPYKK